MARDFGAPTVVDCLLPLVLLGLRGDPSASAQPGWDPRMVERPAMTSGAPDPGSGPTRPRTHTRRRASAAFDGKATYGTPLEHELVSTNFSVQWAGDDASESYAADVSAALEAAWTHLVEEDGWPAPTSADTWLLTVVLDPTVSGSGFTTVYPSTEYPDGYPVSYVSPGFGDDQYPGYSLSVAVHEFGHMIHFGLRDWSARDDEAWYWEATAEWMADRGAPDLNTYALSTWWYATNTTLAYNSTASYHQYGMLLLPRSIEDTDGPDLVQATWTENAGAAWDEVIPSVTGEPLETLIADMSGAYAAGTLSESALFYPPDPYADPEGDSPSGGLYGTAYAPVDLGSDERFVVEGPAVVRYATPGAWGEAAPTGAFTAAITRTGDGTIRWYADVAGHDSDSAVDSAADDRAGDSAGGPRDTDGDAGRACGCAADPGDAPAPVGVLVLGLILTRRRGVPTA